MAALSPLLSLPHMTEKKQTCDPPVGNPPQKHEPAIYCKNFSAHSEPISASCKILPCEAAIPASAPWLGNAESGGCGGEWKSLTLK